MTFTGIENNRIVVDSYSGEAMNPAFAVTWRRFCEAAILLDEVERDLDDAEIQHFGFDIDGEDYFIWRELTPEEFAWSGSEYGKYVSPWTGDMRLIEDQGGTLNAN
jgi:hypothetical protein